jgi:hypothetical protein
MVVVFISNNVLRNVVNVDVEAGPAAGNEAAAEHPARLLGLNTRNRPVMRRIIRRAMRIASPKYLKMIGRVRQEKA